MMIVHYIKFTLYSSHIHYYTVKIFIHHISQLFVFVVAFECVFSVADVNKTCINRLF